MLAIVGPNNAGKSAALREISSLITHPEHARSKVLTSVAIDREGSSEELLAWLVEHSFRRDLGDGEIRFKRPNVETTWSALRDEWTSSRPLATLGAFLIFPGWADNRLGLVSPSGSYDPMSDSPGNPMQVLFARPELEERLSSTCEAAFGVPLTLSRVAGGSQLGLYLGRVGVAPSHVPSPDYMAALRELPPLNEQGDGMRSFMGIMLSLVTAQFPLVLIDEPEAFLHPPQARLLGHRLASDVPEGTQVVVATHSLDVLQGLLDAADARVTVARLRRTGATNPVAVLGHEEIRELWRDPLLRASNTLAGLFHGGVVACEADGDVLFYEGALAADRLTRGEGNHDYLFTYSSTKSRLPVIARSLRALEVPCALVADLDVLREEHLVRQIVEALGGEWEPLRAKWNTVSGAVTALAQNPLKTFVEERLAEVLAASSGPSLTRDEAARIRDAVKVEDGWTQLKRAGTGGVPQGAPSAACEELLSELAAVGLFVVPVGELERWVPTLGGHGPAWVSEALEAGRQADEEPRLFIRGVDEFLGAA